MHVQQVASTANEGSAWNHAGTFEERMFTKWAEVRPSMVSLIFTQRVRNNSLAHVLFV